MSGWDDQQRDTGRLRQRADEADRARARAEQEDVVIEGPRRLFIRAPGGASYRLVVTDAGLVAATNGADIPAEVAEGGSATTSPAGGLQRAANLSDLSSTVEARQHLGLNQVENKSSTTIRDELTSLNVTLALGYTPTSVVGLTGAYTLAAFKEGLSLVRADVGLGSVDNTSDSTKPVSTATGTALAAKEPTITAGAAGQYWRGDKTWQPLLVNGGNWSGVDLAVADGGTGASTAAVARANLGALGLVDKGVASGVASLDAAGKVPTSQLPALAITSTFVVNTQAAQLALVVEEGDVAVRTDVSRSYIRNAGTAGTMADWNELLTPPDAVLSVNGMTGAVTVTTITGNAGTASALLTARTITMTGDISWSVSFTGAGNATAVGTLATVTVAKGGTGATAAPAARANLGVAIGSDVQAYDADLAAIAALVTTGFGRGFLVLADAAAGRTALALGTLATQSGTFSGTSSGTNTGDQPGENVVSDPMFVQGSGRITTFGSGAYGSSGSVRYVSVPYASGGGYYANNNLPVPVTLGSGNRLYFAALIYHADRTSGYGFMKAECFDAAGASLGTVSVSAQPPAINSWVEVTGSATASIDTAMVRVYFDRTAAYLGGDSAGMIVRRLYCGGRPS